MTPQRVQRISGVVPSQIAPGVWVAIDEQTGVERVRITGVKSEKKALNIILADVYRQNRMAAMARDGWRCTRCGSMRNLQAHHKVHRGMGAANRDDRPSALETICADCHRREHEG